MQTDAEVAAAFRPCMAGCNNPACCEVRCRGPIETGECEMPTDPRMTPTNDAPVTVEQDPYLATIEEFEHEDQRELCRLYNHRPDDSLQFSRSNMREAIRHGRRLAALASAPADEEATYTRWLAGDETLPPLPREQYLRFQARSDRAIKDRQTAPATVGNEVEEVRRNPDDCEWTYCPACKTGFLDTGYECNSCGFDAQPLVHLQAACEGKGERMHPSGLYESEIANPIRITTATSAPAGEGVAKLAPNGLEKLSPSDRTRMQLSAIVIKHTVVGGYPDTHSIAHDAYDLGLAAALARPRAAVETVEFVREWLMSGDHPISDWERQFAAAIDARPRAAVGEREAEEVRRIVRWIDQAIERAENHRNTEGIWLFASQWQTVRAILALQSPPAKVEG